MTQKRWQMIRIALDMARKSRGSADRANGPTPPCPRILLIVKHATGGMRSVRLARSLVEHGADVHVMVPVWGPDVAAYRAAGATVHFCRTTLPLARPWNAFHVVRQLRWFVQRIDPLVINPLHASTAIALRLACRTFRPAESSRHPRNVGEASPMILTTRTRWRVAQIIERYRSEHAPQARSLRLIISRNDSP